MKASEIIYYYQNLRQKGIQSDDNQVSDDMVFFDLNKKRALLLRQEEHNNNTVNAEIVQTVTISMDRATLVDITSCNIQVKEGCLLKSVNPLPLTIDLKINSNYLNVSTLDGKNTFDFTAISSIKYDAYQKYTSITPKFFIKNRYLYIINYSNLALKYISLSALFENPKEAIEFNDLSLGGITIDPFNPYEFEYPITGNMLELVYNMMISEELKLQNSLKDDTKQDNQNEQ